MKVSTVNNELWCVRCDKYCKNRMECSNKPKKEVKITVEVAHIDLTRHASVMFSREMRLIYDDNAWMNE